MVNELGILLVSKPQHHCGITTKSPRVDEEFVLNMQWHEQEWGAEIRMGGAGSYCKADKCYHDSQLDAHGPVSSQVFEANCLPAGLGMYRKSPC